MRSTKEGWYVIDGWLSVVGTTTLEIFCKISEDNHQLSIFRIKKALHIHFQLKSYTLMPIPCLFYTDSTSFNRYTERSDVSCPCRYMRYVPHCRILLLEIQLRRRFVGVLSSDLFCLGLSSKELGCYHHRHMPFLRRWRLTMIISMIHP